MRVAVVSDIHGNLTAFEAVLADVRQCSPDLVLHGGDLADPGSSPHFSPLLNLRQVERALSLLQCCCSAVAWWCCPVEIISGV